jgi:hypothetical protein
MGGGWREYSILGAYSILGDQTTNARFNKKLLLPVEKGNKSNCHQLPEAPEMLSCLHPRRG